MDTYIEMYDINGFQLTEPRHFVKVPAGRPYDSALYELHLRVRMQAKRFREWVDTTKGNPLRPIVCGVIMPTECYAKIIKDGAVVVDHCSLENPLYP